MTEEHTRSIKRTIAGLLLTLSSASLLFAANHSFTFANFYAHHIYSVLVETVSRFSNLFPFALSELLLYILIVFLLIYSVRNRRSPLRILSLLFLSAAVLLFIFTVNCGINYRAGTFSQSVGMEASAHSTEELAELCSFLTEQVNRYADDPQTGTGRAPGKTQSVWRKTAGNAMRGLGNTYPVMSGYYPSPKPMFISYFLSVQQVCGIYSPFLIEAIYNREMPAYNIPHSMCHELSHLKGFMHEDEANFISFLACIGSNDTYFCYSGYLTAWVYAGNELAAADRKAYKTLYEKLDERARADLEYNNAFWDRYEGEIAEAQDRLNDAYLKSNGQSAGIRSYNRFVQLMLDYYEN